MKYYVVEHKTTTSDISYGSRYWDRLRLDRQLSVYVSAARVLGYPVSECLYDVIHKPTMAPKAIPSLDDEGLRIVVDRSGRRSKTKAGHWRQKSDAGEGYSLLTREETPLEYRLRLIEEIAECPSRFFARRVVPRSDTELSESESDRFAITEQIRCSVDYDIWPRHVDSCFDFGNECSYYGVCSGNESIDDPKFVKTNTQHSELSNIKHRLPLVTSSSLGLYSRCPRAYMYAYHRGIRPKETTAALDFGTRMHAALEVWWSTLDVMKAIATWESEPDPYIRAAGEELTFAYDAYYRDTELTSVAVEVEFAVPLTIDIREHKFFLLGGKIDAIAKEE